uniref:Uncharacterized protein n=2 Tax=Kalmanozyma brasiliensis (strain GHG001) TaxID=1365824 RepID=V5E3V1_KALBG
MTSSSSSVRICIVNPNSSSIITDALSTTLLLSAPPSTSLSFLTGPPSSPASIQTPAESIISAAETYKHLITTSPSQDLSLYPTDAFLVACFSDHPLAPMLRPSGKPTLHLLEAAILHALLVGVKFGVLTTGKSVVPDVEAGVRRVMGGNSDRYIGTHATGLGVVELKEGDRGKIERKIKVGVQELVRMGADVIVLGCAGMAGMERLVREGAEEVGGMVKVVDGAKAGLQLLTGLVRAEDDS